MRGPSNSVSLGETFPWVSLQSYCHSHAAHSVLTLYPLPLYQEVLFILCCESMNPACFEGCPKYIWSSFVEVALGIFVDSQRSLTEIKIKEKATEFSQVIWAFKSDKPNVKSQLHSPFTVQTSEVWFLYLWGKETYFPGYLIQLNERAYRKHLA